MTISPRSALRFASQKEPLKARTERMTRALHLFGVRSVCVVFSLGSLKS